MAFDHSILEKPKTIVFVITRHAEFGGAQIHIRDLARLLIHHGWNAHIITGATGPVSQSAEEFGIPVHHLPELRREISPQHDVRAVLALRGKLRSLKPDLVSLHSSKAGIIGRLAAASLGLPTIFTAHGWAFTDGIDRRTASLYRIVERLFAPLSRHIICVSENDRRIALDAGISSPARMTTIHNGMPDIALPTRVAGLPDAPIRFTQVARFSPQKNHGLLLAALSGIRNLNWTLTLVGSGDDTGMRALAKKLEIADKVAFLGERRDIPEILANTDVFCLATNWEGFPRASIEAMRAGLPIVANAVGGTAEAIVEGQTGFVVPRDDEDGFRTSLLWFLDHRERIPEMGAAARDRYDEKFTFETMAKRTLDVYETVLRSH